MDARNSVLSRFLFGKNRMPAFTPGESVQDALERRNREYQLSEIQAKGFEKHPLVQRLGLDKNPVALASSRILASGYPETASKLLGGNWDKATKDIHEGFGGPMGMSAFGRVSPITKEETTAAIESLKNSMSKQSALNKWLNKSAAEKREIIDKLRGGLGDAKPDSAFNKKELAKGVRHEQEHTKDRSVAREIAKDHLSERKDYYTALEKAKIAILLNSFE